MAPAGMPEEGLDRGTPVTSAVPCSGTGSGPRRSRCSAVRPSGSQDVASTVRPGQAATKRGGDIADQFDDVLAVVEHQHRVAAGQGVAAGQHLVVAPGA